MRYWLLASLVLILAGCGGGDGENSRQTVTGPVVTASCARLTGPVTINNTVTVNCPSDSGNTTTTPPPEVAR